MGRRRPPAGASAELLVGVACTASLASDRPKRGPHRIHVAWQTVEATVTYSLELVKNRRSRREEEEIAARLILNAVAEACEVSARMELGLQADETLEALRTDAPPEWRKLLSGEVSAAHHGNERIETLGASVPATKCRRLLFPGAFNPLHAGHLQMTKVAERIVGVPVEFEISIENVDKPLLDFTAMAERLAQFQPTERSLWFTRADIRPQGRAVSRDNVHRRGGYDPANRRSRLLRWRSATIRRGDCAD